MSFSESAEQRGDRLIDLLTDETEGLSIAVSRLGAELVSLNRRDKSGASLGFLYRDNDLSAPASGWANHATVMGYFLHRLKDGRSSYRGREIAGGTHSFLRTKIWRKVEETTGGTLGYQIEPGDYTTTEYPLKVSLRLTYRLDAGSVITTFDFCNHEQELAAHLEFGLHPGFAATSFETFQLRMPAGRYRRYFSPENYLSGETEEFDFAGGDMPFAREQLPGSYILEFVDVPDRRFIYSDVSSGREVTLDLREAPYVTLWSDGGPFLCVEPCWGLTDRHNQRPFEAKDGIQIIPPRGKLRASFSMIPRVLPK
jgi:galactose mutarotase-like enzyme